MLNAATTWITCKDPMRQNWVGSVAFLRSSPSHTQGCFFLLFQHTLNRFKNGNPESLMFCKPSKVICLVFIQDLAQQLRSKLFEKYVTGLLAGEIISGRQQKLETIARLGSTVQARVD